MPEIPEMEIYRDFLQESVQGNRIIKAEVIRESRINVPPHVFTEWVQGTVIEEVIRRGKYILLRLSSGRYLLAHMMLDGRIYLESAGIHAQLPGNPYISLVLENQSIIHYCKLRLGYVKLLEQLEVEKLDRQLGLEPLEAEFKLSAFLQILSSKRGMIKPLLMDQKLIAGIGNAYSNEALFAAAVLPERKTTTLTEAERERLYHAIPDILREAIVKGGYIEEKFAPWDNLSGGFIPYFKVYDRKGQPCVQCGSPIIQKVVGGRNAYFCSVCQH